MEKETEKGPKRPPHSVVVEATRHIYLQVQNPTINIKDKYGICRARNIDMLERLLVTASPSWFLDGGLKRIQSTIDNLVAQNG